MRRSNLFVLFGGLLVATGLAAACGSSSAATTTTTTTTTPAVTTTETYSGSIGLNGLAGYNFTVAAGGTVTATLTTLTGGPAGVTVGFGLGTWNGSSCATVNGIVSAVAIQGTVLTGQTSTSGSLCVVIQDASSTLTPPVSYTITVVHP